MAPPTAPSASNGCAAGRRGRVGKSLGRNDAPCYRGCMLAVVGMHLLLMTASPAFPVAPSQAWDFGERIESDTASAFAHTGNGQLWFASRSGLRKWNGRKLAQILPNHLGMTGSDVFALAPGSGDRLWAATGGGLMGCNKVDEQWLCQQTLKGDLGLLVTRGWMNTAEPLTQDSAFLAAPKELAREPIFNVVEATSALWLATARGLWRTEVPALSSWPPSLHTQHAVQVALGSGSQHVLCLRKRANGALLVGTQSGLFEVKGEAATLLLPGPVLDVVEDAQGILWIGTPDGLQNLDRAGSTSLHEKHRLPDNIVQALAVDRDNALWVGTRRGLVRLHDNTIVNLTEHLPHPDVTSLSVDSDNGVWVALRAGGALRAQKKLVFNFGPEHGLPAFGINGIAVDEQGTWISDRTSVWLRPSPSTSWRQVALGSTGSANQTLQGFAHSPDGALWAAEIGQGVWRRGAEQWTLFHNPELSAIPGPWSMSFDPTGGLWVGGSDGTLLALRVERSKPGSLKWLAAHRPASTVSCRAPVKVILHLPNRTTLVGTDGGGIWSLSEGRVECFGKQQGLAKLRVSSMVAHGQGAWLGSPEGALSFFNGKTFVSLSETDGLPCDAISALAVNGQNLWFSCGAGVGIVSLADLNNRLQGPPTRVPYIHFNRLGGMRSAETLFEAHPAAVVDASGTYWTLTRGGVSAIVLPDAAKLPAPPFVDIEQIVIDGRFHAPAPIAIRGDAVDVEVRLQGRTISGARATLFDKRLMGKHGTHFDYSPREGSTYKRLSPGEYKFTARARGPHGQWGPTTETLSLSITLPLYKRPWVLGGVLALLVAFGFALHRRKMHSLEVGYQAVQRERERIARDLHDGLGQGFMSLRFHLETLRRTFLQPSSQTLELMSQSTEILRKVEDESRRTIWNLRAKTFGEQSLVQSLRALAKQTESSLPEGRLCVMVETTGDGATGDANIDSEILQVAGEAVRNAAKHGRAREIHITLDIDESDLRLAVYDDGRGFHPGEAPDARTGHFGVLGMHERLRRLRGTLTIESIPDQGTAVVATVPRSPLQGKS